MSSKEERKLQRKLKKKLHVFLPSSPFLSFALSFFLKKKKKKRKPAKWKA